MKKEIVTKSIPRIVKPYEKFEEAEQTKFYGLDKDGFKKFAKAIAIAEKMGAPKILATKDYRLLVETDADITLNKKIFKAILAEARPQRVLKAPGDNKPLADWLGGKLVHFVVDYDMVDWRG